MCDLRENNAISQETKKNEKYLEIIRDKYHLNMGNMHTALPSNEFFINLIQDVEQLNRDMDRDLAYD